MSLGAKIREFRKERGITLTDLANKLEVSPSFLSGVERDIKKPSVIMLKKISSHLNISVSYLTTDSEEDSFTGEKLRTIREGRCLSVEDLAELSELPVDDIIKIEQNILKPNLKQLERVSSALNVSTRYFAEKNFTSVKLGEKIRALREKNGMSQVDLANEANISPGLVSQLENNVTVPSLDTLEKVANSLGTEVSYFLMDTNHTSHNLTNLSPEFISLLSDPKIQAVLTAVRDLEAEELKFVLNFLDFFKINRRLLS